MELFLDVLSETLVDTAKMLPFLFLAYLFIEYVETRHGERIEALLAGGGRWGAVPGAVLGCVPQCGFSAIASNFYASRVITLGTLMAVYLATSDEAIPLLVSMPAYWDKLILLMVIKVVYAVFVGFLLDFVLRKVLPVVSSVMTPVSKFTLTVSPALMASTASGHSMMGRPILMLLR